jgi:hypothetical protein
LWSKRRSRRRRRRRRRRKSVTIYLDETVEKEGGRKEVREG